jgi:putative CocE/NonD family hydrolase
LRKEKVVKRKVSTVMRDGTILPADLYLPDATGPFPTVVERTPHYKERDFSPPLFKYLAERGYAVLAQDSAGRWHNEGVIRPFFSVDWTDAEDGYDTIEWAANQPWCNGLVGGYGYSYASWTLWTLAAKKPPHLVTLFTGGMAPKTTDWQLGGVFRIGRQLQWTLGPMASDTQHKFEKPYGPDSYKGYWNQKENIDREKWLWFLPIKELPQEILGGMQERFHDWLDNIHEDRWHLNRNFEKINLPIFHRTSWYDRLSRTVNMFEGMQRRGATEEARKNQRMIIGPWSHSINQILPRKIGAVNFGPEAELDLYELIGKWFDYWLMEKKNNIIETAPIRLFIMGANEWRDEKEWPLKRARPTDFYLHSNGKANTPYGDGILSIKPPPTKEIPDSYTYDPRNPVMSLFSFSCHDEPHDQRALDHRHDVLVYQTDFLPKPIEVTGVPILILYASSSAQDTDFTVKLIDVWPNGFAQDLCYGIIRARFREGYQNAKVMKLGKIYKFEIKLLPTSNLFQAGHRIRLDISSSDFPNFDRNHNTGGNDYAESTLVVARQIVFHEGEYASRIILPIIKIT